MRVPCVWLVAALAAGCALNRPATTVPAESPVRANLRSAAADILKRNATGDGWEASGLTSDTAGQTAADPDDSWDENTARLTFTPVDPDGRARELTTADLADLLGRVRADVKRAVLAADGEVLDTTDGEQYRERGFELNYKLDKVAGRVRGRAAPASGAADEPAVRLELTVRERPAK